MEEEQVKDDNKDNDDQKEEVEPWQRLNRYTRAGCGKVFEVKRLVRKFVQMGEQEGRRHLKSKQSIINH